ncbi:MAG: thiamine biosynthesis protein [Thermodesulfobacteriota bacterium]
MPAACHLVALFSGGLDSILACRLLQEQGAIVQAVRFATPFFGDDLLADPEGYAAQVRRQFGIEVLVRDVTAPYLEMLARPAHGYGRHFNPCLDCKILLVTQARHLMEELGADGIITGEVIGQRPMSQRRDTLRVVERDSGCTGLLLRPLCAKHLPPTTLEERGLVDRQRLLDLAGRGRSGQIRLAARFGIEGYPSPAGGCLLTDPNLAARIRALYAETGVPAAADLRLALVGRQLRLPGGGWLALGRNQEENERLAALAEPSDLVLTTPDWPGPTAILRRGDTEDLARAAGILVRFSRKRGRPDGPLPVAITGASARHLTASPLPNEVFQDWQR